MNKLLKWSVLFILSLVLTVQSVPLTFVHAQSKGKSVTILFTHDMHDNLLPLKTLEDDTVISVGGYARLMTAIKDQKEADPEALLVDAGDFAMGTPFQTIYQTDAPELRIMGTMGYDVTTLGNHEFDYRPEGLTGSLEAAIASGDSLPQIVQSNMTFPKDEAGNMTASIADLKRAMENYGVKDYTIVEKNGIKIGIFGVMGDESISMAPMAEVTFNNEITEAKRVTKLLREQEKVDLIVCLSHSGTDKDKSASEDEILAEKVPDIDVIISGHSHTQLNEAILSGSTVIGSCGEYGCNLGVIKLSQTETGWSLDNYELVQINDRLTEDVAVSQKTEQFKQLVQEKYFDKFGLNYDEVVAQSQVQFQTPGQIIAVHEEATIGNLISDAYLYAVKQAEGENYEPVTAAIVPCGTIRNTIFPGDITVSDVFSISSLGIGADKMPGYPLISVYLTGKELKTACEVDASIQPLMEDAQLYMSGMDFTFNPKRMIFNKVTQTVIINEDKSRTEIDDNKLYRIVCGLYSAQMLSVVGDKSFGLMSLVPKDKDGVPITDFEQYIIYEKNGTQTRELKEWYALVRYLKSFDQVSGIPQIPTTYREVEGRKIIDEGTGFTDLFGNPNQISLTVYIVLPVVSILFILLMVKLIRTGRRNRRKRKAKLAA